MSDKLKLKSGKEIYCNCGIIGLAPKSDDMDVYGWHPSYGYDGSLASAAYGPYFEKEDYEYDHITQLEMLEIANIMIERWQEFKKYVLTKKDVDNTK